MRFPRSTPQNCWTNKAQAPTLAKAAKEAKDLAGINPKLAPPMENAMKMFKMLLTAAGKSPLDLAEKMMNKAIATASVPKKKALADATSLGKAADPLKLSPDNPTLDKNGQRIAPNEWKMKENTNLPISSSPLRKLFMLFKVFKLCPQNAPANTAAEIPKAQPVPPAEAAMANHNAVPIASVAPFIQKEASLKLSTSTLNLNSKRPILSTNYN